MYAATMAPPERAAGQGGIQGLEPLKQQEDKVGVLLLNLGGPETLEDVEPFLYNLFADDSIIRLPGPGLATDLPQ